MSTVQEYIIIVGQQIPNELIDSDEFFSEFYDYSRHGLTTIPGGMSESYYIVGREIKRIDQFGDVESGPDSAVLRIGDLSKDVEEVRLLMPQALKDLRLDIPVDIDIYFVHHIH